MATAMVVGCGAGGVWVDATVGISTIAAAMHVARTMMFSFDVV
jgi:hypothetical protein